MPTRTSRRKRIMWISLSILAVLVVLISGYFYWTRHGAGRKSPRIGISVSADWYDRTQLHSSPYFVAVARSGGRAVTLDPSDRHRVEEILDGLDGLILAGGGDVDSQLHDEGGAGGFLVDRNRDRFEMALLAGAEARGIPVLAICRGFQLLVVSEQGTLERLKEKDESVAHRHGVGPRSMFAHEVKIDADTRLGAMLGEGPHRVSSFHSMGVTDPGPRLTAAATCPSDDLIEAVELPGDRWVVGIQWHPELESIVDGSDLRVFRELLSQARRLREGRQ